jgi:hypothetical protein
LGNIAPIPFFNESLHGIKLCILPGLEAFGVMHDKPIVTGVTKFPVDVGFPWAIVTDFLLGESA